MLASDCCYEELNTNIMIWSWVFHRGTLLVGKYSKEGETHKPSKEQEHNKVASFDLDGTLINTISGKPHATDPNDWKWWHPNIPQKLRFLSSQGYHIIIFTNQGRLTTSSGSEAPEAQLFKQKITSILTLLDVSLTVYVACANDIYRKPRTGMWEEMVSEYGGRIKREKSYLVGDAAGREMDHSDSDVHFCENLGVRFFTPEEFFLGVDGGVRGHKFHPKWYLKKESGGKGDGLVDDQVVHCRSEVLEVVILVGLPGAGKSTYYKHVFRPLGYVRLDGRDARGLNACLILADQLLREGKSVVIDDINVDSTRRKSWVDLARKHSIQARAFYFNTPSDLCLHNDSFRALAGYQDIIQARKIFPRIPFRKLQATLKRPEIIEGFSEVLVIEFEWRGKSDRLDTWSKHWL